MSDQIKHECGIAMVRLLKPLQYYQNRYGSNFYGINKMYLLIEKQHNRGQDGVGLASVKFDVPQGVRYIDCIRSNASQPIQDVFNRVNVSLNDILKKDSLSKKDIQWQNKYLPFVANLYLGHLRYGTFGGNSIDQIHPFIRESNWKHRNLILAGNFNMTNAGVLLQELIDLGQHIKQNSDTITIMEKIGHFLDCESDILYQKCKNRGLNMKEASLVIEKELDIQHILKRSSKDWDGGYAIAGLLGHGDAFVLRDPSAIRPVFYYQDNEVVVVASERPAIQTVFNVGIDKIRELPHGHVLIIKKNGELYIKDVLPQLQKKSCSFERIYFSRGSDAEIYKERKNLGKFVFPMVLKHIDYDMKNSIFSYIPNTAEISFLGMVEAAEDFMNQHKLDILLKEKSNISKERLSTLLSERPRVEKIAVKDAKLRTFIADDNSRDDLVAHVYDITYGVVRPTDNLVIIDDSIVRGTTLKKSIIRMMDRLNPKKIVVVSSAPQIRYPDCYGIDMAKIGDFLAFKASIELLKESRRSDIIDKVYKKCLSQRNIPDNKILNCVKDIYAPFTSEQISDKSTQILITDDITTKVVIVYQNIENLHKACPNNLGDWYFTGDYPTPGGNRVANEAFINYYQGLNKRAY